MRALTGPLPYAVRLQEADGPLALDALSEGWPEMCIRDRRCIRGETVAQAAVECIEVRMPE